jgi:hypothetical protein
MCGRYNYLPGGNVSETAIRLAANKLPVIGSAMHMLRARRRRGVMSPKPVGPAFVNAPYKQRSRI